MNRSTRYSIEATLFFIFGVLFTAMTIGIHFINVAPMLGSFWLAALSSDLADAWKKVEIQHANDLYERAE